MMDKRTSKTSSKLSLQKKPSGTKGQSFQQSAAAVKRQPPKGKSVSAKEKTFDLPAFSIPLPREKTGKYTATFVVLVKQISHSCRT